MQITNTWTKQGVGRRIVIAAGVAAAAVASLVGAAQPASANTSGCHKYSVDPTLLFTWDYEDSWPDNADEITLSYSAGSHIASYNWNNMTTYSAVDPALATVVRPPYSTYTLNLHERDPGSSRLLGSLSLSLRNLSNQSHYLSYPGSHNYELQYNVTDHGPAPCPLKSVSLNPSSVTVGDSTTGTVTLEGAAGPYGAYVSLSSSSTNASVPSSVFVPPYASTATFPVTTNGDPSSMSHATIRGTGEGVSRSATLTIYPSEPDEPYCGPSAC